MRCCCVSVASGCCVRGASGCFEAVLEGEALVSGCRWAVSWLVCVVCLRSLIYCLLRLIYSTLGFSNNMYVVEWVCVRGVMITMVMV